MIPFFFIASMFRRLMLLLVTAAALSPMPIFAHDMWIEPTTFAPVQGEIVGVRLRVGEDLRGDPLLRDPKLVNQFVVEDDTGRKPVYGRDGGDPAGLLRVARPGLLVIGYRSNPSTVTMKAETFNAYLAEEGLDSIVALRARRNETGVGARDRYSRCAKSLIFSGSPGKAQADRLLGFPLELLAERNPYAMPAGQELPVRLMYENRPLEGALLVAVNRRNPSEKIEARTDRSGRVRLPLRQGGMWLIKSVHMVPAPAGADAEWESYWASLTFELRSGGTQGK